MSDAALGVFALLVGLAPATIARYKGYSFLFWWLFGAAFLIVALPYALLMPAKAEGAGRNSLGQTP